MGIMPYYPDEQAIENELGGKWEKVETLELNGGEIIEYDKDVDNITPLNINGYMLVFNVITNSPVTLYIYNGDNKTTSIYGQANAFSSNASRCVVRCKDVNGLMELHRVGSSNNVSNPVNVTTSTMGYTERFTHDYFKIALTVAESTSLTGTIDVYFLRGV